jgi:glycosyltransferase involved in cell wall biosynthesis
MARASTVVVCVSRLLAEHVLETYGLSHDRVLVVPNGGTPADAPPAPRADAQFRVVWAGGSRWPWQALDSVLAAGELLAREVPNLELVLYTDARGLSLPSVPWLKLEAPVPHAELAARLETFDAALCLYRPIPESPAGFYNSPLKLFDYMARGLPVVASRLGQIVEIVEDGVSGVLVDDDPRAIARELAQLSRDRERRHGLGLAALERIRARFTWNHTGDALGRALALASDVEASN